MTKEYITKTRSFSFPNSGHSVRKLVSSLEDIDPDTSVRPSIKEYFDGEYDFCFIESESSSLTVSHLLKTLPRLGTRFTLVDGELEFYNKFNDIQHHPEIYCKE